jgi:hypothetical protein
MSTKWVCWAWHLNKHCIEEGWGQWPRHGTDMESITELVHWVCGFHTSRRPLRASENPCCGKGLRKYFKWQMNRWLCRNCHARDDETGIITESRWAHCVTVHLFVLTHIVAECPYRWIIPAYCITKWWLMDICYKDTMGQMKIQWLHSSSVH